MTYNQIKKFYRTQQAAADAIGVHQTTLCYWAKHGIPYTQQCRYEQETGGALKAGPLMKHKRRSS